MMQQFVFPRHLMPTAMRMLGVDPCDHCKEVPAKWRRPSPSEQGVILLLCDACERVLLHQINKEL